MLKMPLILRVSVGSKYGAQHSQDWITPPFECDKYFFPQASWILDAVNEKILPLEGYQSETNVTMEEQMRRLTFGV